jgi:hypothetical protein
VDIKKGDIPINIYIPTFWEDWNEIGTFSLEPNWNQIVMCKVTVGLALPPCRTKYALSFRPAIVKLLVRTWFTFIAVNIARDIECLARGAKLAGYW